MSISGHPSMRIVPHSPGSAQQPLPSSTGVAITWSKRGRLCVIGKLVTAQPTGELVFGVPYRNRQAVQHVSMPPVVLAYARKAGATAWVVRNDVLGVCHRLPLADVEKVGWLRPSEGGAEWFVPLSHFRAIAWQTWAYAEDTVTLSPQAPEPTEFRQLRLDLTGAAT